MRTPVVMAAALLVVCASNGIAQDTNSATIQATKRLREAIERAAEQLQEVRAERQRIEERIRVLEAPKAPLVRNFADGRNWLLHSPVTWPIGSTNDTIVVPAGFVTDLASVPDELRALLSPVGRYNTPAIIHDFLYWQQKCSKEQADKLLLLAMYELQVPPVDRLKIYRGVDLGGANGWNENREARRLGLPRIVPERYWDFPALQNWDTYRRQLKNLGVSVEVLPAGPPRYCARGTGDVKRWLEAAPLAPGREPF